MMTVSKTQSYIFVANPIIQLIFLCLAKKFLGGMALPAVSEHMIGAHVLTRTQRSSQPIPGRGGRGDCSGTPGREL